MAQCELATSSFYMIHSNPWELKLAGPFIMAGWGSLNAKLYIPSTYYMNSDYRKVASTNMSHLKAHPGTISLIMKGTFEAYFL